MSRFFHSYFAAVALLLFLGLPLAAQDSKIGPNYRDAPETIVDPAIPQARCTMS